MSESDIRGLMRPAPKGYVMMAKTEELRRSNPARRSFATADLSDERVEAIGSSRMDERHAHLDAMLEPK
jgi:hypothetical protein